MSDTYPAGQPGQVGPHKGAWRGFQRARDPVDALGRPWEAVGVRGRGPTSDAHPLSDDLRVDPDLPRDLEE